MALIKQPIIATIPIIRIPDDNPNANISKGINPMNPKIRTMLPIIVSVLPTFISNWQLNSFEVFTRNPKILLAEIDNQSLKIDSV